MEALNNYIIIKKDSNEFVTKSGIYIPGFGANLDQPALSPPFTGVVTSVGPKTKGNIKIGNRIVYNDLSNPYWVEDDNEFLIAVLESDVAAVITKKE